MHKALSKVELLRQEWLAALRSGEYRQTDGTYHNEWNHTHCVVGVLIDICAKRDINLIERVINDLDNNPITMGLFGGYAKGPSVGEQAMKEVGLPGHFCRDLYYRNDKMQMSFSVLASYLEWVFKLHEAETKDRETYQEEGESLKAA